MKVKNNIIFLLFLMLSSHSYAHNKVVVIPLGDERKEASTDIFLVSVNSDGSTYAKTSGVLDTLKVAIGTYQIKFVAATIPDITNCFAMGTVSNTEQAGILKGSIGITRANDRIDTLLVKLTNSDGADEDLPFTVQLTCPKGVTFPAP